MSTTIINKTIFRIFVLRVSGKGDQHGSANQLEVPAHGCRIGAAVRIPEAR